MYCQSIFTTSKSGFQTPTKYLAKKTHQNIVSLRHIIQTRYIYMTSFSSMKKTPLSPFTSKRYDRVCMYVAKKIVKTRDRVCQKCSNWSDRCWLQCSHNVNDWSDTRLSVFTDNMILLCDECHKWRHANIKESQDRFESKYPWKRDDLESRSKSRSWAWTIGLERRVNRLNELIEEFNKISGKKLSMTELSHIKFW